MERSKATITTTVGNTTVQIRLFGEVSSERLKAEERVAQHRAEQLSAAWPAVRKEQ